MQYLKINHCLVGLNIRSKTSLVLLVHLLTPWSRVLPEKLTGSQLVKKFSALFGTRRFISAFTTAPLLSQINPIHAPTPLPEDPLCYLQNIN